MATQQKHILIVEDDELLLNVLKDEFIKENIKVSVAQNGEEGLKSAVELKPDLIIIDFMMPKMDGMTMLKKLRSNPDLKNTLAVILTNLNDTSVVTNALESGAFDFLIKSNYEPKELVKRVKEKLNIE